MQTIGLIGGPEPDISVGYLRLANQMVRERRGGLHTAPCLLSSPDASPIEQLQAAGRWPEAGARLAEAGQALQAAGAGVLLLCGITLHRSFEQVQAGVGIPVLHIADAVAAAARAAGVGQVGLIGAAFPVELAIYRERLAARGVGMRIPGTAARSAVHRITYQELCRGGAQDESRREMRGVIDELAGSGAQGIVLASPVMDALLGAGDSPIPLFPATRLHVGAAVSRAMSTGFGPEPGTVGRRP